MSNIILKFPDGFVPRERQVKILEKVGRAFESDKKFVIIDASTGVGKSHVAKTIANTSSNVPSEFKDLVDNYKIFGEDGDDLMRDFDSFGCYALTITKSLQDQYESSFDKTGILKGQSNYQCDVDDEFTVDVAPCIYVQNLKRDCWSQCRCPYYNQRNEMLKSHFSVLNYSMFFSLPDHLKRREILICDEGSELESQLVDQFTCEVDLPFLVKCGIMVPTFPTQETPQKIQPWIEKICGEVEKRLEYYKEKLSDVKTSSDKIEYNKLKNDYSKLNNFSNNVSTLHSAYNHSQYLIEKVDSLIRFIPLKVDQLSKYLFDNAKKVVIMSATIIDVKSFCKSLGISDYEYIQVDSGFDSSKAPIHIMTNQKLNFKNLQSKLPDLMKQIRGILEHHSEEKGIIHTHTQYLADYIRNNIKSDRLLIREAGVRNEELLEIHESTDKPTVLVSPSMTYGVDLKGDLGRFQIIMKAPWLPTKDIRVAKLMELDKDWYSNMMLKTLVQACGRGVRTETDECETYILDGSIFDAIQRNKHKLPKHFLERFA
jgi:ATP-dependent DNA helicase DinG